MKQHIAARISAAKLKPPRPILTQPTRPPTLPRIDPARWCGSYCGACHECRRLDRWLKYTTRGPRAPWPAYCDRRSFARDSIELMKEHVWLYRTLPWEVSLDPGVLENRNPIEVSGLKPKAWASTFVRAAGL